MIDLDRLNNDWSLNTISGIQQKQYSTFFQRSLKLTNRPHCQPAERATNNWKLCKYTIVFIYSKLNKQLKRTTVIQLQLQCWLANRKSMYQNDESSMAQIFGFKVYEIARYFE